MGIVIKNGEIITGQDRFKGDVLVDKGAVLVVAVNLDETGHEVIDGSGKYVFPGGIDTHTHMELPFMGTVCKDDFFTGTRSGVCGGTTTIIDFIIPQKGQPLMDALALWQDKAGKAAADYGFHMAITYFDDQVAKEIPQVVEAGVTSFKAFLAYKGMLMIEDDQLIKLMEAIRDAGGMLSVHAENGNVVDLNQQRLLAEGKVEPKYHPISRPGILEGEATCRAITLAKVSGVPLHIVHMTAREAVAELKAARTAGQPVYGETCPQYLLLDDSRCALPNFEGSKYIMSPPLRKKQDQKELWQALATGYITSIGTDHCPFDFKGQKEMGRDDFSKIPNGCGSVGERMELIYTYGVGKGRFDVNRFVQVTSSGPARLFGLYPKKGAVVPGADADLVVWDPELTGTISVKNLWSNVDHTVWEGFEVKGRPEVVMVRGKVVYRNGEFRGEKGYGQYVPRNRFERPYP